MCVLRNIHQYVGHDDSKGGAHGCVRSATSQLRGIKTFLVSLHWSTPCLTWKLDKDHHNFLREQSGEHIFVVPLFHPLPACLDILASHGNRSHFTYCHPKMGLYTLQLLLLEISKLSFCHIISCPCPADQVQPNACKTIQNSKMRALRPWNDLEKFLPRSAQALTMTKILEIKCEEWLQGPMSHHDRPVL